MYAIKIILYILAVMFFIIALWFFYLAKTKKFIVPITDKAKSNAIFTISDTGIIAPDSQIGKYKISDIVNTIDNFTINFNLINKKTNTASGIVSIFSFISLIISALLI